MPDPGTSGPQFATQAPPTVPDPATQTAPQPPVVTGQPTPAPAMPATAPAAPVAPNPAVTAGRQKLAKDALFGKAAKWLLGGMTETKLNPETGQYEEVKVDQKPGAIWHHILAGAILGGAAAGDARTGGAGFKAGFGAEEANRAQQQERLQEGFKNQMELARSRREEQALKLDQQKVNDEEAQQKVTAAHWEKEQVLNEADFNLRNQEEIDKTNGEQLAHEQTLKDAGGTLAPWDSNGKLDNGSDYIKARKDGTLTAPKGYVMYPVGTVDKTGIHYDFAGKGWTDDKTGAPVDLADRTTIRAYFVNQKDMNAPQKLSGSEVMKRFGVTGLDPNGTYPLTPKEQFAIAVERANKERTEGNALRTEILSAKKAELQASSDIIKPLYEELQLENKSDSPDKDRIEKLTGRINEEIDNMNQVRQDIDPHFRPPKFTSPVAQTGGVVAGPGEVVVKDPKGNIGTMTNEQFAKAQQDNAGYTLVKPNSPSAKPTTKAGVKSSDFSKTDTISPYNQAIDKLSSAEKAQPVRSGQESVFDQKTGKNVAKIRYLVNGREVFVAPSEEATFLKPYRDKLTQAQKEMVEADKGKNGGL